MKIYINMIIKTLAYFSIASFCIAMYFFVAKGSLLPWGIVLIALYFFIVIAALRQLAKTLPLPAFMLMIPILPLLPMILVLIFIPLFQKFL